MGAPLHVITSTDAVNRSVVQASQLRYQAAMRAKLTAKAADALEQVVSDGDKTGVFMGLTKLRVLRLEDHALSGDLPSGYSLLQQLRVLDLSRGPSARGTPGLSGTLPSSYASLDNLEVRHMAVPEWCAFHVLIVGIVRGCTTTVAMAIGSAVSHHVLLLLSQKRSMLVDVTSTVSHPPSLVMPQVVQLSGNNFSGTLPSLWTRLTNMSVLDVADNQLSGQLPPTYVSMRRLLVFDA